jgi:SAM-dependent methyltransferase
MKLNLASGTDIRSAPWVNLDIVHKWPLATRGCDVIWDARKDRIPFGDATADEVYAGYLFLHLAPHHHARVLADIRRVLQTGGRLVVGEVDMPIAGAVIRKSALGRVDLGRARRVAAPRVHDL